MDYDTLEKAIKNNVFISDKDVVAFLKFPTHKKTNLFLISCCSGNLQASQAIHKKFLPSKEIVGEVLGKLLCFYPQTNSQVVDWLFTLQPSLNLEQHYKFIMKHQIPDIWEKVFSYYPFNEKKITQLLCYCISENLPTAFQWLIDKEKKSYLPSSIELFDLVLQESFISQKSDMGLILMQSLTRYHVDYLEKIKIDLHHSFHFYTKIRPNQKELYSQYVIKLEKQAFQMKLEEELDNNSFSSKRLKI